MCLTYIRVAYYTALNIMIKKKEKIMNGFCYNILNKVGHESTVEICLHYFLVLLTQFNTSYANNHSINSLIKV